MGDTKNKDKKRAPEQDRVHVELLQALPPVPGPGLLERLGQGLAALAGVFKDPVNSSV